MFKSAQSYVFRGWAIFPLHGILADLRCTCGRYDCRSPGKHPRLPGGSRSAIKFAADLPTLFAAGQRSNVDIATGRISGLTILDVDFRHGGAESLAQRERTYCALPPAPTVLTGNGRHLYFRRGPYALRNSASALGRGLDVRGEGGYVVAPPSFHASGVRYSWNRRKEDAVTTLPDLPRWLLNAMQVNQHSGFETYASMRPHIAAGARNNTLMSWAGRLRRQGHRFQSIVAELFIQNDLHCRPSLERDEVLGIAKSAMRYSPAPAAMTSNENKIAKAKYRGIKVKPNTFQPQNLAQAPTMQSQPDVSSVEHKSWTRPKVGQDATPWPEPVEGHALLNEIAQRLQRHLILPIPQVSAIALWIVFTYVHDAFVTSPLLALVSPDKRCGKTTALALIAGLSRRALPASNVTTAALFRAIDKWHPTLVIDETDTFIENNEELRGVLNSGHQRDFAVVIRSTGDKHIPTPFSTWSPKALAKIGSLSPTLADRAIVVSMRRKKTSECVAEFSHAQMAALHALCRKAIRWANDNLHALRCWVPEVPRILNDRARDNWRPLLSIAEDAGGDWPDRCRGAANFFAVHSNKEDVDSAGALLLQDIHQAFLHLGVSKIQSQVLAQFLADMEERPWPEWRSGRPITPRQIAQILRPFEIFPKSTRFAELGTPKGYELAQFTDAFERYVDADPLHCCVLPNEAPSDIHTKQERDRHRAAAAPDAGGPVAVLRQTPGIFESPVATHKGQRP